MSLPKIKAVPEVGGNKPVKMDLNIIEKKLVSQITESAMNQDAISSSYIVVVFPAPLCPKKEVICPS